MLVGLICFCVYLGLCIWQSEKSRTSLVRAIVALSGANDRMWQWIFSGPHGVVVCIERLLIIADDVFVGVWRWITSADLKSELQRARGCMADDQGDIKSLKGQLEAVEAELRKVEDALECYKDKYNPNSIPSTIPEDYPNGMAFGQRI
ncbi:TPA: hypothetical protein EYO57_03295 [Candidatus Poribacteria bacterium]|nr:hypothetical protein [Candidatus Poribacteria bacterium]